MTKCPACWTLERKEDLQIAIEEQIEMGVRGLDDDDKYLMEIKLETHLQILRVVMLQQDMF